MSVSGLHETIIKFLKNSISQSLLIICDENKECKVYDILKKIKNEGYKFFDTSVQNRCEYDNLDFTHNKIISVNCSKNLTALYDEFTQSPKCYQDI